jgi:hypothetical protein
VVTDEDTPVGITLTGSDPDEDPLTFSVIAPPSNGTLGGTAPDLTYTPNADYNGSDSFTFKANDGSVDSNTATVSITVNPIDDAPVANAGDNQVVYNQVTLDGSGSYDPDGTDLSYEWVLQHKDNPAYNEVAVGVNPVVSDLQHGFYFVTLTVTDNQGDTATDEMLLGANDRCGP